MNTDQIKKIKKIASILKVLYVEDDLLIQEQIGRFLLRFFKDITYAHNGRDGLDKYNKSDYDIVITDINMPVMDGMEMLKNIKKINEEQIVIITSAHNNSDNLVKLIELGADRFIMKPIDFNRLLKVIAKYAIELYTEKRKLALEKQVSQHEIEKETFLDGVVMPLLILNGNEVEYANETFKNSFIHHNNYGKYNLSELFEDEMLKSMNKHELFHYIKENQNETYKIFFDDKKKSYIIKINKIKNSTKSICYFLNLEEMEEKLGYVEKTTTEHQESYDLTTNLLLRNEFKYYMSKIPKNTKYDAVCFSLKDIEQFVKDFGVASLQKIYAKLGKYLMDDFSDLRKDGIVKIFYFNTNKFVILTKNDSLEDVKKILESFSSSKYYFELKKDAMRTMRLDILTHHIDEESSINNTIASIDNKLYMLKS